MPLISLLRHSSLAPCPPGVLQYPIPGYSNSLCCSTLLLLVVVAYISCWLINTLFKLFMCLQTYPLPRTPDFGLRYCPTTQISNHSYVFISKILFTENSSIGTPLFRTLALLTIVQFRCLVPLNYVCVELYVQDNCRLHNIILYYCLQTHPLPEISVCATHTLSSLYVKQLILHYWYYSTLSFCDVQLLLYPLLDPIDSLLRFKCSTHFAVLLQPERLAVRSTIQYHHLTISCFNNVILQQYPTFNHILQCHSSTISYF